MPHYTSLRWLIGVAILSAVMSGSLRSAVSAQDEPSTDCSVPVGSGALTPSGGNKATLGTATAFAAHASCRAQGSHAYTATLQAAVNHRDGTRCAYETVSEPATNGLVVLRVANTCSTSARHTQVNTPQTIAVRLTTDDGVDSGWQVYPIGR